MASQTDELLAITWRSHPLTGRRPPLTTSLRLTCRIPQNRSFYLDTKPVFLQRFLSGHPQSQEIADGPIVSAVSPPSQKYDPPTSVALSNSLSTNRSFVTCSTSEILLFCPTFLILILMLVFFLIQFCQNDIWVWVAAAEHSVLPMFAPG